MTFKYRIPKTETERNKRKAVAVKTRKHGSRPM
jgi:hypothetical protein